MVTRSGSLSLQTRNRTIEFLVAQHESTGNREGACTIAVQLSLLVVGQSNDQASQPSPGNLSLESIRQANKKETGTDTSTLPTT